MFKDDLPGGLDRRRALAIGGIAALGGVGAGATAGCQKSSAKRAVRAPVTAHPVWTANHRQWGDGVIVSGAAVFFDTAGRLISVDVRSARPLWSIRGIKDIVHDWDGPVTDGKTVYARLRDRRLHALDPRTGDRRWTHEASGPDLDRVLGLVDDLVLCMPKVPADELKKVVAIRTSTGAVAWTTQIYANLTDWRAGPILCDVVPGFWVRGIDSATGRTLWRTQIKEGVVATMAGAGAVYLEGQHFTALDQATGRQKWALPALTNGWGIVPTNERVFVGSSSITALDAQTGRRVWQQELEVNSSLTLIGSTLVAGTESAVEGRAVYGLDSATGALRWRYQPLVGHPSDAWFFCVGEGWLVAAYADSSAAFAIGT